MINWKEKLDECTHGGKYHGITCWGVAHTLGMIALVGIGWLITPNLVVPCAIAGSLAVLIHEDRGPGNLFNSTDRILDWLLPIIVAVAMMLWLAPVLNSTG